MYRNYITTGYIPGFMLTVRVLLQFCNTRFTHIPQGHFSGTGAITQSPQVYDFSHVSEANWTKYRWYQNHTAKHKTESQQNIVPVYEMCFNSSFPGQNGRYYLEWKIQILTTISLNFIPEGPVGNNPTLVQTMVCCRIGDKPLSEPMLTRFLDACICATRWGDQLILNQRHISWSIRHPGVSSLLHGPLA